MSFNPEGRTYPVDEDRRWSVTTALGIIDKSGPLMGWTAKRVAEYNAKHIIEKLDGNLTPHDVREIAQRSKRAAIRERDEAAEIGTRVHKHVEEFCHAVMALGLDGAVAAFEEPDDDPRVVNAFRLFTHWAVDKDFRPVCVERVVKSRKHGYAGTLDLVAQLKYNGKSKLYVIDTKTSNGIYTGYAAQVAAYRLALTEEDPALKIEGMGIIRVGKEESEYEFHNIEKKTWKREEKIFLAALKLYKAIHGEPK